MAAFIALTGWIANLVTHLVPSLADDGSDKVQYDTSTIGGLVNANASDGGHKPPKKFFLPNVVATWPWPRRLNQYYPEVSAESSAWIRSFTAFSPKAQESFDRCNFGLLGCLTYPTMNKEHVRITCDYMNATFLLDEHTDVSEERVFREQNNIVMDVLHNPHQPRPEGEWIGGEIMRQFWERTIPHATAQAQKRFITTLGNSLDAMKQQGVDRRVNRIRDINGYINMRRESCGAAPTLVLIELGLDIPDEVISHPAIEVMNTAVIDMIWLCNDMASFNVEQARGHDDHNMVTVVMHEYDTDINGAMLWIAELFKESEKKFLETMKALPEWGEPIDSHVRKYCDGLGSWVRGYDEWNFEGERYLGTKGPEIKRKRWVTLMPKIGRNEAGPVLVDSVL